MSQQPPHLLHLSLPNRIEQRRAHGLEASRLITPIYLDALSQSNTTIIRDPPRILLASCRRMQRLSMNFDLRAVLQTTDQRPQA